MKPISVSTINRIHFWIKNKEIAGISAYRIKLKDETPNTLIDKESRREYTQNENIRRNSDLKNILFRLDYGVARVKGCYVEGGEENKRFKSLKINGCFEQLIRNLQKDREGTLVCQKPAFLCKGANGESVSAGLKNEILLITVTFFGFRGLISIP